ncbi:MAG: hypothetical protein ACLGHC_06335 [Alphaproteobacteria bacterium]
MRPYLFAIPFLFLASTAVAEPASKREEIRIPPELTDPKLVDRLMEMNKALSKALLDIPVGEVEAAIQGRTPTEADRRRTVRDSARLSDREIERKIAEARPRVQAAMQAFARSLPALTRALSQAADTVERAAANVPQPDYPKR